MHLLKGYCHSESFISENVPNELKVIYCIFFLVAQCVQKFGVSLISPIRLSKLQLFQPK